MKTFGFLFCSLLFISVISQAKSEATRKVADVGDGRLMYCEKGTTKFEIFRTAVPTLFEGQLQVSGSPSVAMKCNRLNEKPSNHYNLWECEEMRNGEGLLTVVVDTGGVTGATIATISQAQMFPLHPKVLQSVNCK